MWKYKFFNSKGGNIIFTKGLDILSLDIDKLAIEMMDSLLGDEKGLGAVIFFGNDIQKFKAVNSFPEILENFINRSYK